MFTLKSRQDMFKVTLPKEFIPDEIVEKYAKIINEANSFYKTPIEFLNETVQGLEVLGFTQASMVQQQHGRGYYSSIGNIEPNRYLHASSDVAYRSDMNPLNLIDKTVRITFRHTLGFVNYFMLFEAFWIMYKRDTQYKQLPEYISVDLYNEIGSTFARIMLYDPIIDGLDMLSLNYTAPIAQSQTFNCEIKYSNIDFQLVNQSHDKTLEDYRNEITTTFPVNH